MAIMDCLLLLQCEFQFKGYIQKDCLIHLRTILFSYVYKKCYNTHRSHRHKLMDIDRRTNTIKKMHKCFAFRNYHVQIVIGYISLHLTFALLTNCQEILYSQIFIQFTISKNVVNMLTHIPVMACNGLNISPTWGTFSKS